MGETPQQILERYVWRVTGLTPERRAMTRARYDIDRAGHAFQHLADELTTALEPFAHLMNNLNRKENR